MTRNDVYNFLAGPSTMPISVLEKAQAELLNYKGLGYSVMEMNHRGEAFAEILANAKASLRRLLHIPDTHEILFLQGGATTQFAAIPMNLMDNGEADYAITGNFSNRAANEARKYGKVNVAYSSLETGHDRIPKQAELRLTDGAKYFYYCANNTVYGTEWHYVPQTSALLVSDMSSDILSCPVDVSKFGIIYAGAQKNMSPAGLTVVIIDKSIAGHELAYTPEIMSYKTMIEKDSLLNTPPCWCIYMLSLMLEWVESMGGVESMDALRRERAGLVYDFLDNSSFFTPHAQPDSRSYMNITFRTPSDEQDKAFFAAAEERGLLHIKGHKVAGGLRASLYNAMPIEGARALVEFMKEYELKSNV